MAFVDLAAVTLVEPSARYVIASDFYVIIAYPLSISTHYRHPAEIITSTNAVHRSASQATLEARAAGLLAATIAQVTGPVSVPTSASVRRVGADFTAPSRL